MTTVNSFSLTVVQMHLQSWTFSKNPAFVSINWESSKNMFQPLSSEILSNSSCNSLENQGKESEIPLLIMLWNFPDSWVKSPWKPDSRKLSQTMMYKFSGLLSVKFLKELCSENPQNCHSENPLKIMNTDPLLIMLRKSL